MRRTLRPQAISQLYVDDREIVDTILAHLRDKDPTFYTPPLLIAPSRAPPETLPFFAQKGTRYQISVQLHSAIEAAIGNRVAWVAACHHSGLKG